MPATYRKYLVDEAFFDVIDIEAKAYWLGFLTADASIAQNHIRLMLKGDDAGHLEKFKEDLGSTHRVVVKEFRTKPGYSYASLQVGSQRLVRALERLGVGEKKSLTVKPCEEVPAGLARHYWRGLVDGDGSLGLYIKKHWSLSLLGTESIVCGFVAFVSQTVRSRATARPYGKIWTVKYTGNRVAPEIMRLLYSDASVYLDRKRALADKATGREVCHVAL